MIHLECNSAMAPLSAEWLKAAVLLNPHRFLQAWTDLKRTLTYTLKAVLHSVDNVYSFCIFWLFPQWRHPNFLFLTCTINPDKSTQQYWLTYLFLFWILWYFLDIFHLEIHIWKCRLKLQASFIFNPWIIIKIQNRIIVQCKINYQSLSLILLV